MKVTKKNFTYRINKLDTGTKNKSQTLTNLG